MKLLITGGSGFIGKHLCDMLGCEFDLYIIGTQNALTNVKSFVGKEFPYYSTDYSAGSLGLIFEKVKPNAVVHLAAHRPAGNNEFIDAYFENLRMSANLFEACLNNNITNIINTSTRLIYTQQNSKPWAEKAVVCPNGYYALSKHWVEQTAAYFNNKGLNIKTLRLAQVIGYGEREGYLLQIYTQNAKNGLPLTVFGECRGKRHYIYVNDVVAAIRTALLKPKLQGIYNIGMKNIYGFDELAQTINQVYGNKSEIIYNTEAKADENIYKMDISKAERELGWNAIYDLSSAFVDMSKFS